MATLEELYKTSTSPTIAAAKAMGTADARQGVNFFDGTGRGPWSPTSTGTTDVWQGEFVENKEGKNVTPAATNNGTYPLSRWKADALKIAFEGVGPAQRPNGYFKDTRFTEFKDTAGRMTDAGSKLHKYAPLPGKQFAGGKSDKGLNVWANTRVLAAPSSTGGVKITG